MTGLQYPGIGQHGHGRRGGRSCVTTLPPTITQAEYGVYGLQAVAVIITFCTGIVLVPSLTTSIFSGQGGQAAFPGLSRFMRR